MSSFSIVVLAAALINAAGPAEASGRLVTFDDLQRRLGEPHLRLLDARPQSEYKKAHVPGAVWVDPKGVEKMAARPGALTDGAAWEAWIAPLGIGPETGSLMDLSPAISGIAVTSPSCPAKHGSHGNRRRGGLDFTNRGHSSERARMCRKEPARVPQPQAWATITTPRTSHRGRRV